MKEAKQVPIDYLLRNAPTQPDKLWYLLLSGDVDKRKAARYGIDNPYQVAVALRRRGFTVFTVRPGVFRLGTMPESKY